MKIGGEIMDEEANLFAVCLLIPKNLLLKELEKGIELTDDSQYNALCKKLVKGVDY